VFFKVNRAKNTYPSFFKNGIKSQKKTGYEGNSIKFEATEFLANIGDESELLQMAQLMPNRRDHEVSIRRLIKQNHKKKIQVSKLADIAKKEVWPAMVFNLSIEPAFRFNLCVFGDKSNQLKDRASYLTKYQVIYLETDTDRYEVCRQISKAEYEKELKENDLKLA